MIFYTNEYTKILISLKKNERIYHNINKEITYTHIYIYIFIYY